MPQLKKQWDVLTDEERKGLIDRVITFFVEERNEEIGIIAAEELLDFFLENLSKPIYNKGIDDSKEILKRQLETLEIDLDAKKQKD